MGCRSENSASTFVHSHMFIVCVCVCSFFLFSNYSSHSFFFNPLQSFRVVAVCRQTCLFFFCFLTYSLLLRTTKKKMTCWLLLLLLRVYVVSIYAHRVTQSHTREFRERARYAVGVAYERAECAVLEYHAPLLFADAAPKVNAFFYSFCSFPHAWDVLVLRWAET